MRVMILFLMLALVGCSHFETSVDARETDKNSMLNDNKLYNAKNDKNSVDAAVATNADPFGDLEDTADSNNNATTTNISESEFYLDKIEFALRNELANQGEIIREPNAVRIKISDQKLFAKNSDTIKPEAAATLESIVKVASHFSKSLLSIKNYYLQPAEKNSALALQRSKQINDYLISKHVTPEKNLNEEVVGSKKLANQQVEIIFTAPQDPSS